MKALRALRTLHLKNPTLTPTTTLLHRFLYSAQPQQSDNENDTDSVFDSTDYTIPNFNSKQQQQQPNWDEKYRERADKIIFGKETQKNKLRGFFQQDEEEKSRRVLAKALLEAALDKADDEEEEEVKEEDQMSLSVGIIGAPNAGKSALTNYMVCSFLVFRFVYLIFCSFR